MPQRTSPGESPFARLAPTSRLRRVDPRAEEVGRAFGDAFADSDRAGFLALMHPKVEMYLPRSVLEGGPPYRGLDGAEHAWSDAFDLWKRFEVETRSFEVIGDTFILVNRARCFPHREGPPVEYDGHWVIELRDGKIRYARPYLDGAEARRDAEARASGGIPSSQT